jgi:hypothetical protein
MIQHRDAKAQRRREETPMSPIGPIVHLCASESLRLCVELSSVTSEIDTKN